MVWNKWAGLGQVVTIFFAMDVVLSPMNIYLFIYLPIYLSTYLYVYVSGKAGIIFVNFIIKKTT